MAVRELWPSGTVSVLGLMWHGALRGGGRLEGEKPAREDPAWAKWGKLAMLISCVAYQDRRQRANISVEDIDQWPRKPDCFAWVALRDATDDELRQMQEEFDLHELAVEDARHGHQRLYDLKRRATVLRRLIGVAQTARSRACDSEHLRHERVVLAAARSDGVNLLPHALAAAQQAQPAHQADVVRAEPADREHAKAAGREHRQKRTVLELADDARP